MKLIIKINPKHLFRFKKSRSVSRSDPLSFSGSSSSDSSDLSVEHHHHHKSASGKETPTSVLRSKSLAISEISGDWSDITRQQLVEVLRRVGAEPPTDEELALMLSEVECCGDGSPISLEEFGEMGSACDSEELKETFEFFDADGDGRITAEELHAVFAAIGDERCTIDECRRMITLVDKSGDGFVCFEDFSRMMEQR
ncbi:Calcium-binding protein CML36 [Actinidia chinensis var. chinensis]|uniref:Calcium-binding protein CML36 n=1 Tax=Actinidia chinensis var. chinensis TaxID=1590841 RepID=A0A2R6RY70_ACTCC|nr:Calcium-binding protein CML36 [Actinidia chinensis var. chinensis]